MYYTARDAKNKPSAIYDSAVGLRPPLVICICIYIFKQRDEVFRLANKKLSFGSAKPYIIMNRMDNLYIYLYI